MNDATTPPITPNIAVPAPKKRTRARRSPSESLLEMFSSLALGDVIKFAEGLVARDGETARFLHERLARKLQEGGN